MSKYLRQYRCLYIYTDIGKYQYIYIHIHNFSVYTYVNVYAVYGVICVNHGVNMHTHIYKYIVKHKNCSPAVGCRNHLKEITACGKQDPGSHRVVSGLSHGISLVDWASVAQ